MLDCASGCNFAESWRRVFVNDLSAVVPAILFVTSAFDGDGFTLHSIDSVDVVMSARHALRLLILLLLLLPVLYDQTPHPLPLVSIRITIIQEEDNDGKDLFTAIINDSSTVMVLLRY